MGVRAGSPVASSQDSEQARAAEHPFTHPMLNKLLILAGSDLGQIEGGGNPGERRSGSSLGKENPWQVTAWVGNPKCHGEGCSTSSGRAEQGNQ